MIALSLAEVAAVTGGVVVGDEEPVVTGPVVIDSRRAVAGGLFAALPGEHADGHDYVSAARAAGVAGVLVSRPPDPADGAPAVLVRDVAAALADVARAVRARSGATVLGVTGSSGKTTTKDLVAQVLAADGATVAPPGSFNNELGLPLTVCSVEPETRWLVLEYSARGAGHIRWLTTIARPDVAAVLNVGHAHVGKFGGLDQVARAKGELVEALPSGGTAVLNGDDPRVSAMAERTTARCLTFGSATGADVRFSAVTYDDLGRPAFHLDTPAGRHDLRLQLVGAHQVANAAAVVALGLAAGLRLEGIAESLEAAVTRSPHRMAVRRTPDGTVIVDDAYNANPESMAAALDAVSRLPAGRRWAVLGAMRELGADADRLHRELGGVAAAAGIDRVLAVGDAAPVAAGATATIGWQGSAVAVGDRDEALRVLTAELAPGDLVLVKASNAEQLWLIADALIDGWP